MPSTSSPAHQPRPLDVQWVSRTKLPAVLADVGADWLPPAGSPRVVICELDAEDQPALRNTLVQGFVGVVAGIGTLGQLGPEQRSVCDVVVSDTGELDQFLAGMAANPIAALALTMLLRGSEGRAVDDALLMESAVYSTLQAGAEFARWSASRASAGEALRRPDDPDEIVHVERSGGVVRIVLARPRVRNALNARMRDRLIEVLDAVVHDPSVAELHLLGAGPSFSSGGDLTEFGSATDPSINHLVRLDASIARRLAELSDRTVVHLHGSCLGAGIELPAFAQRVTGTSDLTIRLPEVSMGLVPGAGGTWSIPRRIGRHRAAWLCISGATIDVGQALDWGLVDEVAGEGPDRPPSDS